jgi:hypothetical protein
VLLAKWANFQVQKGSRYVIFAAQEDIRIRRRKENAKAVKVAPIWEKRTQIVEGKFLELAENAGSENTTMQTAQGIYAKIVL